MITIKTLFENMSLLEKREMFKYLDEYLDKYDKKRALQRIQLTPEEKDLCRKSSVKGAIAIRDRTGEGLRECAMVAREYFYKRL